MNGPHRLISASLTLSVVLTACTSYREEIPPAMGSVVIGTDPVAIKLFAEATAAEEANKKKQALKSYRKISTDHAYSEIAPQAKFREAHLLDTSGELIDAFEAYQAFIQRYPSSKLYSQALSRQAVVAHAAAQGRITTNFLGIKNRIPRKDSTQMLAQVRDNAPRSSEAPRAQFAIGQIWESTKDKELAAIGAYETLLDDYPNSSFAPEAQYRIGAILLAQADRGNQSQANLDKADDAFHDLVQRYPNSKRTKDARAGIRKIAGLDLQRSYNVAEFYYKKKKYTSAALYFREVIKQAPDGPLKNQASQRLAQINALTS